MAGPWLRTGDIVHRDRDGVFRIVDRRKDIFISGGENVAPAEVERASAAPRDRGRRSSACRTMWGERGVAFVVRAEGRSRRGRGARARPRRARGFQSPRARRLRRRASAVHDREVGPFATARAAADMERKLVSTVEQFEPEAAFSAAGKPLTKRGEATRRKLLEAAEEVFARLGYHEASIVKITERAGIGLGTFYLYFDSKQQIFEELVVDLNRRVRHAMAEAMAGTDNRIDAERAGFEGSSASRPPTRRSTASCVRRSSSRPRCCACTTRASWTGTKPGCAPPRHPATSMPVSTRR
jgi:hypothetical protein